MDAIDPHHPREDTVAVTACILLAMSRLMVLAGLAAALS